MSAILDRYIRGLSVSEHESYITVKVGGEKSFGVVFALIFSLVGLYPLVNGGPVRTWALVAALAFLLLAFLRPALLAVPNRLWFKISSLMAAVMAPIVMALVYFLAIVPVGVVLRWLGKDPLLQKWDEQKESYWVERDHPVGTMKDQF